MSSYDQYLTSHQHARELHEAYRKANIEAKESYNAYQREVISILTTAGRPLTGRQIASILTKDPSSQTSIQASLASIANLRHYFAINSEKTRILRNAGLASKKQTITHRYVEINELGEPLGNPIVMTETRNTYFLSKKSR